MPIRHSHSNEIQKLKSMLKQALGHHQLSARKLGKLLNRDRTAVTRALEPEGTLSLDLLLEITGVLGYDLNIAPAINGLSQLHYLVTLATARPPSK